MTTNSYYGNNRQITFADAFPNATVFETEFTESPIYHAIPSDFDNAELWDTTYFLLYSYYGNSVVASSDINRFKAQLFSTMYRYGPTWAKRTELQTKLRALTDAELAEGITNIYNHANNPATLPTAETPSLIQYVDAQNQQLQKRDKLSSYVRLWDVLEADVVGDYINKFRPLFKQIVSPELPLWYVTPPTDEEGDDE